MSNGIVYRVKSPESFAITKEIFKTGTYDPLLKKGIIRNFVDLGCNTGYVACLLADRYGPGNIKGLLVDANPEMIEETGWHLRENGLLGCRAIWGLVGPSNSESCTFHMSEFNLCSSARPLDRKHPLPLRTVKEIAVPVFKLERLFDEHFGGEKIDFLKVDIEGSEEELLCGNISCLRRVEWVVLEWHKWIISLEEVKGLLDAAGFRLGGVLKEDDICGLAMFGNRALAGGGEVP